MAALEKITYKPLIDHFKECQNEYDQQIAQFELKHGQLPVGIVVHWVTEVVQPIIVSISDADEAIVANVTRVLFDHVLRFSSGAVLVEYEDEFSRTWKLASSYKAQASTQPSLFFNTINAAILAVIKYNPSKLPKWVAIMEGFSEGGTVSFDDFKKGGKIAAWMCGLAHLREQSKEAFISLNSTLKEKLSTHNSLEFSLEHCLQNPWLRADKFELKLGGFKGFNNGVFKQPPILVHYDEVLFATDGNSNVAVFFDAFGTIILENSNLNDVHWSGVPLVSIAPMLYQDISSSVLIDNFTVFTRTSSHFIFIQFGN